MELILMILTPFPIGFLVRNRTAAFLAYIALHSFVFTVQTAMLVIEWVGGDDSAFGIYPHAATGEVWAYAAVNTVIYAVGPGLVLAGSPVAARRNRPAELDSATV